MKTHMFYPIKRPLLILLSAASLALSACGAAPPLLATAPAGHLDYPSILNVTSPLEEATDIKSSLMSLIGVKDGKRHSEPATNESQPHTPLLASLI